jgi:hypothetical protein
MKKLLLNLISLFYVAFRLAPFILVCFFTLSSVFNQDLKGFIYLIGLLIACFFAIIIGNTSTSFTSETANHELYGNITKVCNVLNLGKDGPISNLPLSTVVFSYTLFYLVYPISQSGTEMQNLPTIILFPLLIIGDAFWNYNNGCSKPWSVFAAMVVGLVVGIIWALIIYSLKLKNLLYFNSSSNKETCSRPAKQKFRCVPSEKNL